MASRVSKLFLCDADPVTRIIGAAAAYDGRVEPWVAAYFSSEEIDLAERLAGVRSRLDGLTVELSTASEDWEAADVVLTRRGTINAARLQKSVRLRLIQKLGRWPSGIDVEAAHAAGVQVSCLPRPTLALTAEHAVLLMLATAKRIRLAEEHMAKGKLAPGVSPMAMVCYNWAGLGDLAGLYGETVGLLGFGEVAREVARCLRGFSVRVLYWSRHRAPEEIERACGVTWCELDPLLAEARYVSVHLPLAPATRGWMDTEKLARMRMDGFLINTSRGEVVDEVALYDALIAGRIAGAGLDVHAAEPCAWDGLRRLTNVIVTPHIAGGNRSKILDEAEVVMTNLAAIARGETPAYLC